MKSKVYLFILFLFVIGTGSFVYLRILGNQPCVKPIEYSIGVFDSQFDIARSDFLSAIEEASALWEEAAQKDLFSYDPNGEVKVNLIYDERQQATDEQQDLEGQISSLQELYQSKTEMLEMRNAEYKQLSNEYENLIKEFNSKNVSYESLVRYWNRRGGAPEKEYSTIMDQQKELLALRDVIEEKRILVNNFAKEVNVLVAEVNNLARTINKTVDKYNASDLVGVQFDQGLYTREGNDVSINIYQFTDRVKLVRVLAHELGHVLGIDHNANPESIMYELNIGEKEVLTKEDLVLLTKVCNIIDK